MAKNRYILISGKCNQINKISRLFLLFIHLFIYLVSSKEHGDLKKPFGLQLVSSVKSI